jgi:RHS repeat-associated protein
MNQDTVSNLYDFPAREYGIQGRWPSPDPAGISAVSPGDPQSWNRYAYVLNNPLALTEPTGLNPGVCQITNIFVSSYWVVGPPSLDFEFQQVGASSISFQNQCINVQLPLPTITGPKPTPENQQKPQAHDTSPCAAIAGKGGTIPVATPNGELRLGFDAGGHLTGIGAQFTGNSSATTAGFSVAANTFAGVQLTGNSTLTIGFNNAIQTPSSYGFSGYVQSATYSGGSFTSANGAAAFLGVPLGRTTTPSSLIRNQLNRTPGAASMAAGLVKLLQWTSQNVTCADLLGGG